VERSRISGCKSLIFLHIPRSGGTTLQRIIERQYPRAAIFTIDGRNAYESIAEFKSLPEPRREKIVCLKGHVRFGLHHYLRQPCTYVTLLRDPVDRVISHYYYVLRTPNHYFYKQVISRGMSLDEYVRSGPSRELSDGQARMVAGIHDECPIPPADTLAMAKKNLKECFTVVGLTERFDESLVLMKRRLAWKWPCYTRRNVTRNRPPRSAIPRGTVRLIQQRNEKDLELYAFAKQLFAESIREEGPSLVRELRSFRFLNRAYGVSGTALAIARRVLRALPNSD